jgi:hypothetical protein
MRHQEKLDCERGLIRIQGSYGKEGVGCNTLVYVVHFQSTI